MKKLNEQQEKAANFFKGPCLSIACPGAGKTTTLTERIARLIDRGVNPRGIVCITFTNKAAEEMKERILKRLNIEKAPFFIGTYHAFCANLLRKAAKHAGYSVSFSIIDSKDQEDMMKKVAQQVTGKDKIECDVKSIVKTLNHGRENSKSIDEMREDFHDDLDWDIAKEYLNELKKNNLIDFSGLLYDTYKLLKDNDKIREKLQDQIEFIQVDEFQDTNYLQFELIRLLADKHKNIFLTGDVSQSIYCFRNARIQNIDDFLDSYDDVEVIPLGQNYRSTPEIVKVIDSLISHNSSHKDIEIHTDNESGHPVMCKKYKDSEEEAEMTAYKIKDLIDNEGWYPHEIAVLYRMNSLSLELQLALGKEGIPYTVVGGPSFFDRKEIKDVLSMLRFYNNNDDKLSFHRVMQLIHGIGIATINKIEDIAEKEGKSILEVCNNIEDYSSNNKVVRAGDITRKAFNFDKKPNHAGDAILELAQRLGYMAHLKSKHKDKFQDKKDNVQELINNATSYGEKVSTSINKYLQDLSLASEVDKETERDKITLQTIHSAKGLEFPVVFMVGMEERVMPHYMALNEAEDVVEAEEEERRICYVSASRAEELLICSYCKSRRKRGRDGRMKYVKSKPSRFLYEMGLLKKEKDDE